MAGIYAVMYLIAYVLPVIGTLCIAWLLWRFWLKRYSFVGGLVALMVSFAASCVVPAFDQVKLRQSIATFAQDEVLPDQLSLPPGRLLVIEDSSGAGVQCGYPCPIKDLPFATELRQVFGTNALGALGDRPVGRHDLWHIIDTPDRTAPFPFDYAWVSLSAYNFHAIPDDGSYKMPHWPDTAKGVHMLLPIPDNGMLDFATAEVLYRRFNVQDDIGRFFLWGLTQKTVQSPTLNEIVQDLQDRISK
ncbi:hypothetical protein [Halocynthiibacter sp.]|uniref:hypothetical protein n=1 Tax=Halocynthiibacter sp. TaxID=1979210 RepID=UPI003C515664